MSDFDVSAIMARANAALPGPWTVLDERPLDNGGGIYLMRPPSADEQAQSTVFGAEEPRIMLTFENDWLEDDEMEAAMAFIAHARTDVPFMAAEVMRLQARVTAMGSAIREVLATGEVLGPNGLMLSMALDVGEAHRTVTREGRVGCGVTRDEIKSALMDAELASTLHMAVDESDGERYHSIAVRTNEEAAHLATDVVMGILASGVIGDGNETTEPEWEWGVALGGDPDFLGDYWDNRKEAESALDADEGDILVRRVVAGPWLPYRVEAQREEQK